MTAKPHINIITEGHVDHGKSTLIGRLLFDTKSIKESDMRKLEQEAKEKKKETFEFAFVMDTLDEERKRGLTIDICHKKFESKKYFFTIIDCPGHKDFIKNMITGASQADAAILVLSAKDGIQEQTKEHVYLSKVLGIEQLIIIINKMDTVNYDQKVFENVKQALSKLLMGVGYKVDKIPFIPASAWKGDNIVNRSDKLSWYKGPTLLEALDDNIEVKEKPVGKPLRVPIQEVYSITGVGSVSVGEVKSGIMKVGDSVVFMPSNVKGEVKSIEMHHQSMEQAMPGDNIGFNVRGVGKKDIHKGDVLGTVSNPPKPVKEFTAQIIVLQHPTVITKGYSPVFHCHTAQVSCKIEEIIAKLDPKTGGVLEENPDFIKTGDAARVKVIPTKPLVVEKQSDIPELARFAIRDMGMTVAAGMILDVVV